MVRLFITLIFLLSARALADDGAARPRVLVLEPGSTVIDKATVSTVAGLMIVELSKDQRLDVISSAEVKRLAELEGDRQAVGCGDASCLAEIAGAMGARYVVFGDVGTLGSVVVMNLNLFDSQTTRAINRVAVQADSIGALPAVLPGKMRELAAPLVDTGASPTAATTTSSTPTPAPAGDSGPLLGIAVTTGGVVLGGAALAADALSPTSSNSELDAFDVLFPVTYCLVAPAVAIWGATMLFAGGADDDATATTTGAAP